MKIFLLSKHDGENQVWFKIKDETELKKWLKDGSIEKDDLIIYPKKIKIVKLKKVLELMEVK